MTDPWAAARMAKERPAMPAPITRKSHVMGAGEWTASRGGEGQKPSGTEQHMVDQANFAVKHRGREHRRPFDPGDGLKILGVHQLEVIDPEIRRFLEMAAGHLDELMCCALPVLQQRPRSFESLPDSRRVR